MTSKQVLVLAVLLVGLPSYAQRHTVQPSASVVAKSAGDGAVILRFAVENLPSATDERPVGVWLVGENGQGFWFARGAIRTDAAGQVNFAASGVLPQGTYTATLSVVTGPSTTPLSINAGAFEVR